MLVMRPPVPDGIDVTDFDLHTEIFDASYLWAREAIDALEAEGNSAIAAILATGTAATNRSSHVVGLPREARSG